jgi:hypothetical protein
MPLLYFHIRKGGEIDRAMNPVEVPDGADIAEEAVESARDLLAEGDLAGLDRRDWAFEIEDTDGNAVLTFPFSAAVEPDLPT